MVAEPQPSLVWRTKGTSSQTPEGAAKAAAQKQNHPNKAFARRILTTDLTDSHDNQNQCSDGNNDQQQITIVQGTGGEIGLGFLRPGR